jgi:hypothetical protein
MPDSSPSENAGPSVEIIGGAAAKPSRSDAAIADYQRLISDKDFETRFPQQHAALRASVDETLAGIGYQPPPTDPRTAQQLHDQQRGVAFGPAGETLLPPQLADVIEHDTAGAAPDPEKVAAHLARAGLNVETVLADAKFAIEKSGQGIKPEQLSAYALAQLAVWGAHLRKHAASRPQ